MSKSVMVPTGVPEISPEQQLLAIREVVAIGVFDTSGYLRDANAAYRRILGLNTELADAVWHRDLCLSESFTSERYQAWWGSLCEGTRAAGRSERLRPDGQRCQVEFSCIPVRDATGEIAQILEIVTEERLGLDSVSAEHTRCLPLVAEATDAALLMTDANDKIVYVNRGFTRMFGWQADEVIGRSPAVLLPQGQDRSGQAWLYPGVADAEEIVVGKDARRYWAKILRNPVLGDNCHDSVLVFTDITSAKIHEALQIRALQAMASGQSLAEVLTLICHEIEGIAPELTLSILEVDDQGCLRPLAVPGLPKAFRQAIDGLAIGPRVGSCGTAAWRNDTVRVDDIEQDPLWDGYRELLADSGFKGCWANPIRDTDGSVLGVFAFYFRDLRDATAEKFHQRLVDACSQLCALALKREASQKRIQYLAFYDGTTGLPNRELFCAKTTQRMAESLQQQEPMALMTVDLNRFRKLVETFGHAAGEDVLQQVAQRLQRELQPSDVLGRLSGDQFALLVPDCNVEQAELLAQRLVASFIEPLPVLGEALPVMATLGVAMFPEDGRDVDTLLQRAALAMDQARTMGRAKYAFFDSERDLGPQERQALERELRQALRTEQLHLHYQPQLELANGSLYGVEALARWQHPELGNIPPSRFIALAEECGLVVDLGRWVLREACRQLASWRAEGLVVPAVSVNMSSVCFHHRELPQWISDTLADCGLLAKDLMIELTESLLLDHHPETMATVHAVHDLGIRVSMDDFGTGYSSLSYLRRLPVTELKLDRSFVADLENDEAARALSSAILGIGRSLQLTVVAEGVETEAQKHLLREQGYAVAQGYWFSQPLAPDALAQWVREQQGEVREDVPLCH